MNCVELLAPAKNIETAIAAINSGADAIYIGASNFGARINAGNNLEDISALVNYAHKFYVKVHVTINTILNDKELNMAIELINKLYKIGVDAIIIQDMGLLNAYIQGKLPPIQLHMSTQCDNSTLEKIKFFDQIGVSRVILARELSLDDISEICRNVNCEIETFVHGALCVCYSGKCYFSYANGGRSANRGECAQPCRKRYSLIDENGKVILSNKYLLSLKDFNASESIEKLILSGVKSFKIEGRLKDVNYVKNVTLYYNNLINCYAQRTSSGKVFTDVKPDLNKTFNRSYTDYFLNGRSDCSNFSSPKFVGEKVGKVLKSTNNYFITDALLNPQDGICYEENGEYKGFLINKIADGKVYPNTPVCVPQNTILYRNYDAEFYNNICNSKIIRKIGVSFKISKGIIYAEDEDGNIVSVKISSDIKSNNPEKMCNNYMSQLSKVGESDFYLLGINIADKELPFIPISGINKLRRELLQKLMNKRIECYSKNVQNPISYAKYHENKLDYTANIMNKSALNFYKNCGCESCEFALETKSEIPHNIELMRTKHCLRFACGLCSKSVKYDKKLYLTDDKGKNYPLKFDCKKCEMVVLSP